VVFTYQIEIQTNGFCDIHDITSRVNKAIEVSGIGSGLVCVFVNGSTAGITTCEYESGLVQDLKDLFEKIIPRDKPYHHDKAWGDGNGFSHVRSSLLGPGITIPFSEGRLLLGMWQQVILIDFDNRPRKRTVIVQVIGE